MSGRGNLHAFKQTAAEKERTLQREIEDAQEKTVNGNDRSTPLRWRVRALEEKIFAQERELEKYVSFVIVL